MNQTITTINDMYTAGETIAASLHATDIVTLTGELGAGKTTLTKGIMEYFGVQKESVTSPSFSIMNLYQTKANNDTIKQIVHIDTYRLETADELFEIGFEEYVADPNSIIIIEWPEKIMTVLQSLPNKLHQYTLEHVGEGRRLTNS
jgi:tRNA threonylcarbamoyladenosine biosynthesis protein TsaE